MPTPVDVVVGQSINLKPSPQAGVRYLTKPMMPLQQTYTIEAGLQVLTDEMKGRVRCCAICACYSCSALMSEIHEVLLRLASQPRCGCYVLGGGCASARAWTLSVDREFATDREQRGHVIIQWYMSSSTAAMVTSAESW